MGAIADAFSPLLWGNAQGERGISSPLTIALKGRYLNTLGLSTILKTDGLIFGLNCSFTT